MLEALEILGRVEAWPLQMLSSRPSGCNHTALLKSKSGCNHTALLKSKSTKCDFVTLNWLEYLDLSLSIWDC